MKFVVGCPVKNRAWILPRWREHVEAACEVAGVEPTYLFVAGTSRDESLDLCVEMGTTVVVDETPDDGIMRSWGSRRYDTMVYARNRLLQGVREKEADYFLSVDSDILLHPEAIKFLLETSENANAVGGRVYLALPPNEKITNAAFFSSDNTLRRLDTTGVLVGNNVEVLMALKLMDRQAYSVDYAWDRHGEDIGWSRAVKEAGLAMAWDGRATSLHVMEKYLLDTPDKREGLAWYNPVLTSSSSTTERP